MPYKPTGQPPGRPRKDGLPAGGFKPKPELPKPEIKAEAKRVLPPHGSPVPYRICFACYPDGWPHGATGLACEHGIWSRPWTGR